MHPMVLTFVILTTLLICCSADPCRGLFCKNEKNRKGKEASRPRGRNPRPNNEIWCERLEAPRHGQILPQTKKRFQPGESVAYKCPVKYGLFGHTHRTCRNDGTWSGKAAFCRGIDCGNPVILNGNASLIEGQSTYRSVAHARCDSKPEIIHRITCDRHGLWKPRIHCRRKKPIGWHLCKNPHLTRCLVEKSMKDHSLIFRPPEGRELFGNRSSTCLQTGEWYPELPKCYKTCLTPHIRNSRNVLANGTSRNASANRTFTHGQHLTVECLDDHMLSGRSTIKCLDGIWKPSFPTCSPIVRMHYLQDVSGSGSQLGTFIPLYLLALLIYSV